MSENAFVAETLRRRLEVSPLIPAFPGIFLSKDIFNSILALVDADGLGALGHDLGKKHFMLARELFQSRGKSLLFGQFLDEVLDKHGKWFKVEGDVDVNRGVALLRHDYCKNWSTFLCGYLSGAYNVVSHGELGVDATDNLVKLRFEKSSSIRMVGLRAVPGADFPMGGRSCGAGQQKGQGCGG